MSKATSKQLNKRQWIVVGFEDGKWGLCGATVRDSNSSLHLELWDLMHWRDFDTPEEAEELRKTLLKKKAAMLKLSRAHV